ncbi:MAG: ABC transporter substrate-binding protein [Rhizobiales bacterium]|nr:ABC transporter substrate-binding protein [Hyphomicrobiales bacterium]
MSLISRRHFFALSGALGAGVAIGPHFAWAEAAGTPKKGGTLRFAQVGVPPGYDLQKWWNAQAGVITPMLGETLIKVNPYTGERVPALVEGEPAVSEDGLTYTFKLKPNVKFAGGHGVMTADDVKFSWERLMSKELGAESAFIYTGVPFVGLQDFLDGKAKDIAGLKAVDDLTFEARLERPDSAFLPAFSYSYACVMPRSYYEGKALEAVNWSPVGTGPYLIDKLDQAKGLTLVRNPDYWNPDAPFADAVQVEFNVEPQLSLLRIQKNELDLMLEPIPAASLNQIRNDPKLKDYFHEAAQNDCQWLSLPLEIKPFDDLRVRKAVAMAVNKQKLAKVMKGTGVPANGTFFSPKSRYFEDGVAYPYDPEGAKKLLAEAGFPNGIEDVPFWYQNQPPYSDMGPAILEDLAQVGIKCKAEAKIYDQFIQETNPGPPAVILFAWEDAYGHGSYIIDAAFTSGAIQNGCCNYPKVADPKIDELAKLGHSADLAVSDKAYRDVARLVVKDKVLWVPLLYPVRCDLANKRVKGFESAVYPTGQSKRFDMYWIED